jgi:hypothetical protein
MPLPNWVRLPEAVLLGTSVSEKQAKRDLCNALADRKIRLRICFMWRPAAQDFLTGRDKPTTVRYVKKSQIPAILKPGDFNWSRSQIRKTELWSFFGIWQVLESVHYAAGDPSPHYLQRGRRSLAYEHRVELHRADVLKVLCTGDKIPDEVATGRRGIDHPGEAGRGEGRAALADEDESIGAKTLGIIEAIKNLWPDGIIPKGLSAKERDDAIKKEGPIQQRSATGRFLALKKTSRGVR